MCSKSWTITADIEVSDGHANGMVVTHGGLEGGYGLYLRDGKPTFVYNFLGVERPTFIAKDSLPKGKTKLVVDFVYDGGGMGKGGTIPVTFSLGEGLDVGMDVGSPRSATGSTPARATLRSPPRDAHGGHAAPR